MRKSIVVRAADSPEDEFVRFVRGEEFYHVLKRALPKDETMWPAFVARFVYVDRKLRTHFSTRGMDLIP